MKEYNLSAVVSRQVVDDIVMKVEARSEQEALAKADRALNVFPEGHHESGIPIMYIKSRQTDGLEILNIVKDDHGGSEDST